jgi:hypothetical protein
MSTITIEGLDELQAMLDRAPDVIRRESELTVGALATESVEGVKDNIASAPRVDLNTLRGGIHFAIGAIPGGVQAIVKPSGEADRYDLFVEEDTRPHWPPSGALQGWADRHGIPEFLVRRAIATRGTKGIHMFAEEYEDLIKRSRHSVEALGLRIIQKAFR